MKNDATYLLMKEIEAEIKNFHNVNSAAFTEIDAMKAVAADVSKEVAIQIEVKVEDKFVEIKEKKISPVYIDLPADFTERAKTFKKGREKFALQIAAKALDARPETFKELRDIIVENWESTFEKKPSYDMGRNFTKAILLRLLPDRVNCEWGEGDSTPKDIVWL
jgi:hypothetical protein